MDSKTITTEYHGGGTRETVAGEWWPGCRPVYSWVDGVPHVCAYDNGVRVVFHRATDADRAAMYNGGMSYDPETCPTRKAWAAHVAEGGD